jgi:hypothetical protein
MTVNGHRNGNGKRGRFDRDAAFAFFLALGFERSFGKVARQFGVSDTTIRKWAHLEGWEAKAAAADRTAAQKVESQAVRSLTERQADTIRVAEKLRAIVLDDNAVIDAVTAVRTAHLYAKLEQLFEGQPTEITMESAQSWMREVHNRLVERFGLDASEGILADLLTASRQAGIGER